MTAPAESMLSLWRARRALLAGLLALSGQGLVSQDPKDVPPPRRRPEGYRALTFPDRQDERRQSEIGWMGGQPSPAHQDYKKQLATEHLERFAASFPRPQGGPELPMIQGPSTVSWRCIGPTKGVSTYSGITNPDVDSGRIAPQGLAITADGLTLYLASATGGLWKTSTADRTHAGNTWTWTPLTDSLPVASSTGNIPIGAVALSPSGAALYIGAGDFNASYGKGFYRSSDGGTSWTETSKTSLCGLYASDYISCIFPVDETTLLVGGNAGLFRSTDGGASFGGDAIGNRVLGPNGYGDRIWSVEQVGSSSQNLVASLQITGNPATGSAWYSSDGGLTWNQAAISGTSPTLPANIGRITLKSNKAAGNTNVWGIAHVTPGPSMFKGIFLSTDAGRTYNFVPDASSPATLFSLSGDGQQGGYNQCLAVSPTGTNAATTGIFTASNLGFYRSTDGGSTWTCLTNWYTWPGTPVYSHADKHTATWSPDGSALYVGNDGGLSVFWDPYRASIPLRPTGTGSQPLTDPTFVDNLHNEGLSTHLVYHLGSTNAVTPTDAPSRVTIGLQDNSTRRRTGTLASSTQFDEAYATGDGFGTLIHKLDGNKIIVSGVQVNLGYSLDGGSTFSSGNSGIDLTGGGPFHTRVEPGRADATGNTAYTATNYKLFKSTNFGQSWTACAMGGFPNSGAGLIRNFNSSSTNPLKLVIVDATHCWISADGGATWIDKGAVYPAGGVEVALSYVWFDSLNDSVLYAASAYTGWGPTIQHLWRSADGGSTWQNIEGGDFPSGHGVNLGGPVHIIQNDPSSSTTLLAGTDFGLYSSLDSGATWTRYGVGLPLVGVHDFFIAPDGSFIRAATYGRGVWESTGQAHGPTILAQPQPTTAYQGLDTSFSVQATGAYSYQWQTYSGSVWVNLSNDATYSSVTSAALAITAAPLALSGTQYRVVVRGTDTASPLTVTSNGAQLTLIPPPDPTVQTQPSSSTLAAGGNGSFTVLATWATTYQWQVNDGSGNGWTNLANGVLYGGVATSSLSLTGVTLGMSTYQYRVVVTGAAAASNPTKTSSAATLTVVVPPSFTAQPASATVATGSSAGFAATVTGALALRWQVKIGVGAWTDLVDGAVYSGSTTASLTISAPTSGMDGYSYRLVATGSLALSTTSSTVTLGVKDPAGISVQPADTSSLFNAQAHFSVTATGYSLSYQWQEKATTGAFAGTWVNISDLVNYGGFTTASLSVWASTTMGGYQYRVVVTGGVGAPITSNAATLTVLCTPSISVQPLDRAIDVGGNATFTVTASSALGYLWKVNSGSGYVNVPYAAPYTGNGTASLTITGATSGMNGYLYQVTVVGCAAPNATSTAATLSVGVAPSISVQPSNQTLATGASGSFTVTALAAMAYQWQVNSGSGFVNVVNNATYAGATSATLALSGATLGMSGYQYQVIVTGAVAPTATSNPATLTVLNAPAITGQPASTAVTVGGSTSFTVSATGAGLNYQWQVNPGSGYVNVVNNATYAGATSATLTLSNVGAGLSGALYQVVVSGTVAPSVTSSPATLTVNTPPSIGTQPANSTISAGSGTSFTVLASGTGLSYQWQVNLGSGYINVVNSATYSGATTATLTLSNVGAGLSGALYQVVVTGTVAPAVTSLPATLTVNTPPSIGTQPANATISAGSGTSFTVLASGTGLSYQWQVNSGSGYVNVVNNATYSGATTATLTLSNVGAGLSGALYQVVVTGIVAPSVTSSAATLTVNTPPSIGTQPANSTISAGSGTSFTVSATGTGLSYQWQVNPGTGYVNVVNNATYAGATLATLTLSNVGAGLSGALYQVVVTGIVAPSVTSSPATLTVNTQPSIGTQPANATISAGSGTSFTVGASGTGLSYQWQVNTGSGYVNVVNNATYAGTTSATLTLSSVGAGLSGALYQVVVSGTVAPSVTSSPATLTVNTPPSIGTQPANATISAGSSTTFTVVASGTGLSYQWQVNPGSGYVNVVNNATYSGTTSATLTLSNVGAGLSGAVYQVVVTGTVAPAVTSLAATLTVNTPPSIGTQPANSTISAGSGTAFTVVASGTGLSYQWQVNPGSGYVNVVNNATYSGATTATLTLSNVGAGLSGALYQVVVSGTVAPSVTSSPATLTVNTPPSIGTQPANATISAGNGTSFTVAASGTGLSYQWQVNTGSGYVNVVNNATYAGTTSATLTLSNVGAGLSGALYQVVVSGTVAPSVTSSPATLTVNTPPSIGTQPANATISAGSGTSFTVGASGTGLSYQWQVNTGSGFVNVANNATYGGATSATLTLSNVGTGLSGALYQVVVSGTVAPAVTSSPTTLTVNTPPSISTQPASATISAASGTSFTVVASGTGLSYQWQVNPGSGYVNLVNNATYSGTTTATLTLSNVGSGLSGALYQVVVSGTVAPSVTSSPATLTVNTPPSIGTQPANSTISAGSGTSFTVVANGTGLGFQWQVNPGTGYVNLVNSATYSGATTATLTLSNVGAGLSGALYQVVVSGTVAPAVTSLAATLTVNTPPSIGTQPANSTISAGSGTSFTVVASGTGLSYQWQVNPGSGYVNVVNNATYSGATTATLTLSNVGAGLSGALYQVVVSGIVAPAVTSSPASLMVNTPPSIGTQPANATISAGSGTSFTVGASGTGLSYQWQVNPGSGYVNVVNNATYSDATTATLTLSNVGAGLSGALYQVVVSGTVAPPIISTAATLTVLAVAPLITTQPLSQTVVVGDLVTFTVTASGSAPLTYQWRRNGTDLPGQTSPSYSFVASQADQGALFSATVTNSGGQATSLAATLVVTRKSIDLNSDGTVNVLDLAWFFKLYAPGVAVSNSPADLNGDGFVDDADLALLLAGI